ncbi:insulinase family protein [Bacillus sp. NTK074B]|uniref:M16 family metallopeptidase n=1 Tax=Bacillus sp. NTK074B TaxID=2802174 RepID=UPI001A8E59EC|nr:insulinase family protein [Bacillus sp. NTK074B]
MQKICLPNGIRLLLDNDANVNSVSIGVMLKLGSKHESPDLNGIVHFLEHILFKNKKDGAYYNSSIEEVGGRFNAFTGKELTCFHLQILKDYAVDALKSVCDMVFSYNISEEDFENEKQVVLQEIYRYQDDSMEQVKIQSLINALGSCSHTLDILGSAQNISSFSFDTVKDFHKNNYDPANAVISVSGNLDSPEMSAIVDFLTNIPHKSTTNLSVPSTIEFKGGFDYTQKNNQQSHLSFIYPAFTGDIQMKEYYSYLLLNHLIGGGRTSRMNQFLREKQGLVYSAYSQPIVFEEIGLLRLVASTSDQNLERVIETIFKIVNSIKEGDITEEEFTRSKLAIKSDLVFSNENTVNRMFFFGQEELLGTYKSFDIKNILECIDGISMKDVKEKASKMLSEKCSLAVVSSRENLSNPLIDMIPTPSS